MCSYSSVGQSVRLITVRSAVQARVGACLSFLHIRHSCTENDTLYVQQGTLAQLVARRSHNPKVVSSILTGPSFSVFAGKIFFQNTNASPAAKISKDTRDFGAVGSA